MKTEAESSENLLQRLIRSMSAIEIVPGGMVKVRKSSYGREEGTPNRSFRIVIIDSLGSYLESIEIKENEYLMYIGIEKIGPFNWIGRSKRPNQKLLTPWNQEIFAFKFLFGEQYVYLVLNQPHDYYQVFIKNLQRIGGIVSFGK